MIELGTLAAGVSGDSRGEECGLKAEGTEQCGESAIQFIAKSAAPLVDDFMENGVFIEYDLAPEGDIKVFEGDRLQVRAVQGAESFVGWSGWASVTNAGEIGRDV